MLAVRTRTVNLFLHFFNHFFQRNCVINIQYFSQLCQFVLSNITHISILPIQFKYHNFFSDNHSLGFTLIETFVCFSSLNVPSFKLNIGYMNAGRIFIPHKKKKFALKYFKTNFFLFKANFYDVITWLYIFVMSSFILIGTI